MIIYHMYIHAGEDQQAVGSGAGSSSDARDAVRASSSSGRHASCPAGAKVSAPPQHVQQTTAREHEYDGASAAATAGGAADDDDDDDHKARRTAASARRAPGIYIYVLL